MGSAERVSELVRAEAPFASFVRLEMQADATVAIGGLFAPTPHSRPDLALRARHGVVAGPRARRPAARPWTSDSGVRRAWCTIARMHSGRLPARLDPSGRRLFAAVAALAIGGGCGGTAEGGLFGASGTTASGASGTSTGGPTGGAGGGASTSTTSSGSGGASTSTTGVGGAGGASTTTTTGAGGSQPALEADCLNGVDDDLDGAVDCADTDCQSAGFQCVAVPAGAIGVFVSGKGGCPAGTQARSFGSCAGAACSCSATSAPCSFQLTRWNFDDCASGQPSGLKTNDGCYYVNVGTNSAFLGTSTPTGATSCVPEAAAVPATSRAMCEVVAGAGCAGGGCLSPAVGLDDACALLPAGSACPAPFDAYSEAVADFGGAACNCGCAKTSDACSSTVTAYADQSCKAATGASAPIDGACHPLGALGSYYLDAGSATPSCAPGVTLAAPSGVLCCRKPPA